MNRHKPVSVLLLGRMTWWSLGVERGPAERTSPATGLQRWVCLVDSGSERTSLHPQPNHSISSDFGETTARRSFRLQRSDNVVHCVRLLVAPNGLARQFRPGPVLKIDRKSWAPSRMTRLIRLGSPESIATVTPARPDLWASPASFTVDDRDRFRASEPSAS